MQRVCAKLAWLTRLIHEFIVPSMTPVLPRCNNQVATHIAKNLVYHESTKHIELDCHFVREQVQCGQVILEHVPSKFQLADIFTKPLLGP